jgi:hypothetical protein
LYPLLYRVDIDGIASSRRVTAGSGATVGSSEYLVMDLRESEFTIFFLDFESDTDFKKLVVDEINI